MRHDVLPQVDEPEVKLPKTYRTRRHAVVTGSFTSCDLGNSLMLKLCGFIEDQHAEILDVNETRLQLRVGRSWLQRWWHGVRGHGPLEVTLDIDRQAVRLIDDWRRIHAPHAVVRVHVRPLGRLWRQDAFEESARQVMQRLRRYLIVG
jgi:hypothetical protein